MHKELSLFFVLLLVPCQKICAKEIDFVPSFEISESSKNALKKGKFVINSQVDSSDDGKTQSLDFFALGLHSKNCKNAMVKLSRYEIYPHYLDFIKEVNYDSEKEFLSFTIDHSLLPFKMGIEFNIPRIKGAGVFNYKFDKGFLKDLKGLIELNEDNNLALKSSDEAHCLFKITSNWSGPHTQIPKTVFELFSITLTRIALEKMFRMSGNE